MDNYMGFNGYSVYAPQYATVPYGAPADNTQAVTPAPVSASPASFGASANFAVAGWLAAIIVGFAAYRYLWEKAG